MYGFQITPVVKNIMIANVVVFLLQVFSQDLLTHYLSLYDVRSDYFKAHQFVTYMFLHANFSHIFFNMLWLMFMGTILERFLGDKKFFILYVVCGIGAGMIQVASNIYDYPNPELYQYMPDNYNPLNVPILGASGAVAGVMMAVTLLFPNSEVFIFPIPMPVKLKYMTLIYIAIDLYSILNLENTGVAHFAHLGGMVFGFILIKIWQGNRRDFY